MDIRIGFCLAFITLLVLLIGGTPPASSFQTKAARPSGPIQFTDVTAQAGIHFKHNSGAFGKKYLPETMGGSVCVLDYDNDGWQDILFV
ncbi:MAG TPA: CRTAC1 family protein, partial [Candidatus Angelobacter sp.]